MSVESVARDFVSNMENQDRAQQLLTPDAMVDGGILPQALPATEAFRVTKELTTAIPDLRIDIQQVSVNGNQATVDVLLSGNQTGSLNLPVPGMMPIPATGKHISAKDRFIVTVQDEKVSHMTVNSPSDGGIPAILGQLGVKLPPI